MTKVGIETERRFTAIPVRDPKRLRPARIDEIRQTYLVPLHENEVERVRRVLLKGGDLYDPNGKKVSYEHTTKTPMGRGSAVEVEKVITWDRAVTLLKRTDQTRRVVCKTRYTIPYKNQTVELDVFPEDICRLPIVEVELPNIRCTVNLPPGLLAVKEITGQERFSNFELSVKSVEDVLSTTERVGLTRRVLALYAAQGEDVSSDVGEGVYKVPLSPPCHGKGTLFLSLWLSELGHAKSKVFLLTPKATCGLAEGEGRYAMDVIDNILAEAHTVLSAWAAATKRG